MRSGRRNLSQKLFMQRKLGELLVESGYLADDKLKIGLEEQAQSGGLLGEILVSLGFVTEWDVAKCLVGKLQVPFIYPSKYDIPRDAVDLLPHAFLHQHRLVPLDTFGKCLTIATIGNISQDVVEEIEVSTSLDVTLYVALASDILKTLQEKFPLEKVTNEFSEKFDQLFHPGT